MLLYARHAQPASSYRYITILLSVIALGITAFGFYFLRFGFDVNDEAYQTMNAMEPLINPQAILSSTLSNLFGRCFGFSFYSMRVLTFLLTALSIALAAGYYYRIVRKPQSALMLYILLLSASLCTPTKARLIGWDCYAVFFTTLSMIFIVSVWRGGGWKSIICLGVFAGCATLCRFPDVVIVPVAILAMFGCADSVRCAAVRVLVFLAVYCVSVLLILSLIYDGEPLVWIESLQAGFVSGHNVGRLVGAYIHTGRLDVVDIILLSLFLFIAVRYCGSGWRRGAAFAILFIILTGIMFVKLDRVFYTVCRLLTACVVILSAVYVASVRKGGRLRALLRALAILGCCVVPMAGSDGGTSKFMNMTSLPMLLALLTEAEDGRFTRSARLMTWTALLSIAIVMPSFTAGHTTFDGGWRNARSVVNHELFENNTTTFPRAVEINSMLEESARVLPDSALLIGNNNRRFFSEYLFGRRNRLWPHSWSSRVFEDREKIDTLLQAIRSGSVGDIAFVKYGAKEYANFADNPMRNAIMTTGMYTATDCEWFVIFHRKPLSAGSGEPLK